MLPGTIHCWGACGLESESWGGTACDEADRFGCQYTPSGTAYLFHAVGLLASIPDMVYRVWASYLASTWVQAAAALQQSGPAKVDANGVKQETGAPEEDPQVVMARSFKAMAALGAGVDRTVCARQGGRFLPCYAVPIKRGGETVIGPFSMPLDLREAVIIRLVSWNSTPLCATTVHCWLKRLHKFRYVRVVAPRHFMI